MSMPAIPGMLAVAAAGIALGLMPGLLPLSATLGLEALLLLVVSLTIVWKLLRTGSALEWARTAVALPRLGADDRRAAKGGMRPGTALFFIGAATVVEITWRPAGRLTLSDVFFLASFAWCCYAVLHRRSIDRVPALLVAGVCLFAIGGALSTIDSHAQGRSIYELARGIWVMLLWPWTAATVLRDRRDVLIALVLWTVAGSVNALDALGQTTGVSAIAGDIGLQRATGFGNSPNDLGAASATLLVPALALALKFRVRWSVLRGLQWGAVALVAASLVASGSVSGMAGALVGLLLWTVSPGVRRSVRVGIVLALVGGLMLSSTLGSGVPSPVHRVQEVFAAPGSSPNAGSAQGHVDTIKQAWPRIRRDPIVGIGLDNAALIIHNGLVAAWLGGGILTLLGLLLVFGAVLSFGWWAAVAAPSDSDRAVAWSLVCAVVAFFVFFANQPLFFNQYGFVASALLVAWSRRVADARALASGTVRRLAASSGYVPAAG